jgi:integrase
MFVLAYCAGLRLGEIVRLTLKDVDLKESAIEIRGTKFFKSRRQANSRFRAAENVVLKTIKGDPFNG